MLTQFRSVFGATCSASHTSARVAYFKLPDRVIEKDGVKTTQKGGTFFVKTYGNAYEVNVSELNPGERGSTIYNAIAGLANTTGKVFRGDTQGLSDLAILRRTENMVSNALKYGANTVMPHDRQLSPGGKMAWAAPVKPWTSDPAKNLTNLLLTSAENVKRLLPEITDYAYNWQTKGFEKDGRRVDSAELERLSDLAGQAFRRKVGGESGEGGRSDAVAGTRSGRVEPKTPYGRDSIARAIVTLSLVRAARSGARSDVLGATGVQRTERSLDDALRGILYSQPLGRKVAPAANRVVDRKAPAASGIPKDAKSQRSLVTDRLPSKLGKFGKGLKFERVVLPDTLSAALDALGRITGRNVVVFRATEGRLNANGFVVPSDPNIYVNADSDSPVLTVAVHEFLHKLREDRPELYDFIRKEVENRADFGNRRRNSASYFGLSQPQMLAPCLHRAGAIDRGADHFMRNQPFLSCEAMHEFGIRQHHEGWLAVWPIDGLKISKRVHFVSQLPQYVPA